MADWLDAYKASVGWGDEIYPDVLFPSGVECCWHEVDGIRYYDSPGTLSDITTAIAFGQAVHAAKGQKTCVLFIDEQATEAQVEEAMHRTCDVGLGCGFIHPKPATLQYKLLSKYSEGTLLEAALKAMQEGNDG